MTEREWGACADPEVMLAFLRAGVGLSARKERLFACACCRRVWDLLAKDGRKMVEAAEDFADGLAGPEDLRRAAGRARGRAARTPGAQSARWASFLAAGEVDPAAAATRAAAARATQALFRAAGELHWGVMGAGPTGLWLMRWGKARGKTDKPRDHARAEKGRLASQDAWWEERQAQADLLRCVAGNPFRRPLAIDTAVLRWHQGAVTRIAQTVYDERSFEDLPVLADALDEAGCSDVEILGHLRGPGPHVRGWWVIDRLLGKG
jgi:hypothetical protein